MKLPNPARLLDRAADYELNQENRLVREGHEATKPLLCRCLFRFLAGFGFMLLFATFPRDSGVWWERLLNTLGYLGLALVVGVWSGQQLRRAGAYRNGWVEGREHLVQQIPKHESVESWLDTNANHDIVHVLGMPPIPPPPGHVPGEGKDG